MFRSYLSSKWTKPGQRMPRWYVDVFCRLFTSFASAEQHSQGDDASWLAAFKLSYSLGASIMKGSQTVPSTPIAQATNGSHLMQLAMQHQQLTAPPAPVAGQGKISWNGKHHSCLPCILMYKLFEPSLCKCIILEGMLEAWWLVSAMSYHKVESTVEVACVAHERLCC